MKKLILVLVSLVSLNSFSTSRFTYTGDYTTEGNCTESHSTIQVMGGDKWLGAVGTGPLDDGDAGCKAANEILNCESQFGTFEYGYIRIGGFHLQTPVIFSFECK